MEINALTWVHIAFLLFNGGMTIVYDPARNRYVVAIIRIVID